jgi:putative thioredoxin
MPAVDVTDETFEAEVLERSETVPVVIDLWAPWCGPCRTLGPIIERVVDATDGKVALAKIDVDQNPRVQAAFQAQSIPAVFAISKRQVVDRFIGALPERSVQEFVSRLIVEPSEADLLVEAGDETSLRKALELEPAHEKAVVALAELLAGRGESEEALSLLARVPESQETRRIAAIARLAHSPEAPTGEADAGQLDDRLTALLARIPGDEEARQEFVDILETMDADDPRRDSFRRALASKLF